MVLACQRRNGANGPGSLACKLSRIFMGLLVALVFENNDALKAMGLSTLKNRRQTRTTHQTEVAGGQEEGYACYAKHWQSASMNNPYGK